MSATIAAPEQHPPPLKLTVQSRKVLAGTAGEGTAKAKQSGMWIGRLGRELDELNQEFAQAASDEEIASFELTRSARAFSQRARDAADDKLAFSATLVRAGEVGAANRMIHDLEQDVRGEETTLIERVNEVKAAAATRRAKMTRLRLARTLAVAALVAGLLSFAAASMTVASFLADLGDDFGDGSSTRADSPIALSDGASARDTETRSIRLPDGTKVKLTRNQFRQLKSLTQNPNLDRDEFVRLLIELLGPEIAGQLSDALAGVTNGAAQAAGTIGSRAEEVESKVKELDSSHTNGDREEPSAKAPASDGQEPVEKPTDPPEAPKEPNDDGGVIDAPLGSKPNKPSVLDGN